MDHFEAHQSVLAVIYAYSRAVDRGDFDAVGELFARGTYAFSPTKVLTGHAVGEQLRGRLQRYDDGTPRTVHVNANVEISFDPELSRAVAWTPTQVFQVIDGEIRCIYLGYYDDTFETDGTAWYFTSRSSTAQLVGDMSAHMVRR